MISKTIAYLFSHFGLVMFFLAIMATFISGAISKSHKPSTEIFFRWLVLLPVGITGIFAFIMHAFFPDFTAGTIGWQNSPFQYEVAMANLGFGLMGVLSFKASYGFRLATVVGNTCWLWGDAIGHIYQMIAFHDFASGNAGSWFWIDLLAPLFFILCIVKLKSKTTMK